MPTGTLVQHRLKDKMYIIVSEDDKGYGLVYYSPSDYPFKLFKWVKRVTFKEFQTIYEVLK